MSLTWIFPFSSHAESGNPRPGARYPKSYPNICDRKGEIGDHKSVRVTRNTPPTPPEGDVCLQGLTDVGDMSPTCSIPLLSTIAWRLIHLSKNQSETGVWPTFPICILSSYCSVVNTLTWVNSANKGEAYIYLKNEAGL